MRRPRLVAGLTRMLGDLDAAEDLAQDALLAALEQWPRDGVPPNPGAWLMLTAKHRAIARRRALTPPRPTPLKFHPQARTEEAATSSWMGLTITTKWWAER